MFASHLPVAIASALAPALALAAAGLPPSTSTPSAFTSSASSTLLSSIPFHAAARMYFELKLKFTREFRERHEHDAKTAD